MRAARCSLVTPASRSRAVESDAGCQRVRPRDRAPASGARFHGLPGRRDAALKKRVRHLRSAPGEPTGHVRGSLSSPARSPGIERPSVAGKWLRRAMRMPEAVKPTNPGGRQRLVDRVYTALSMDSVARPARHIARTIRKIRVEDLRPRRPAAVMHQPGYRPHTQFLDACRRASVQLQSQEPAVRSTISHSTGYRSVRMPRPAIRSRSSMRKRWPVSCNWLRTAVVNADVAAFHAAPHFERIVHSAASAWIGAIARRQAFLNSSESRQRLTNDLVHVVIAIGCQPPDEPDVAESAPPALHTVCRALRSQPAVRDSTGRRCRSDTRR